MPRGVVPDQLANDVATHRSSTKDGENFERDHSWIGRAPAEVSLGVFSPCVSITGGETLIRLLISGRDAHISARGPSLPFTVLPNVERYNQDPSYVK